MPVIIASVSVPTYTVTEPPDIEAIGPIIDEAVWKNFGQAEEREVAIRGISLIDHPGHTHDSLAEVILATGTDRYDPERVGPTEEGYARYGVELHVGDEKPPYSACRFKDPDRRRDALLGLIKVLS